VKIRFKVYLALVSCEYPFLVLEGEHFGTASKIWFSTLATFLPFQMLFDFSEKWPDFEFGRLVTKLFDNCEHPKVDTSPVLSYSTTQVTR